MARDRTLFAFAPNADYLRQEVWDNDDIQTALLVLIIAVAFVVVQRLSRETESEPFAEDGEYWMSPESRH